MEAERSKLYVGGIARETTEDALREHFGRYGGVSRAVVPRERDAARAPRGFAFVWFADPASARAALRDEEHVILGKKVGGGSFPLFVFSFGVLGFFGGFLRELSLVCRGEVRECRAWFGCC